jgi:hypothetical protein
MQSNFALIWLLVSALLFVSLARSFDRDNPTQGVWLLVFAAAWPLLVVYLVAAAILATMCLPTRRHSRK